MTPPPLVTIRYENRSFEVAYGLRTGADPHGEAGFDAIVDGVAVALGIVVSRVATMDPEFLDGDGMQQMKAKFWTAVETAVDKALTMEPK